MSCRKRFSGTSVTLLLFGAFLMADDKPQVLFEFTRADATKEWQTVNDGVMGGVSEGKFKITEQRTLEFVGTLSLENNGGFASVRTKAKKLGLGKGDVLVARVRGDGREYSLNLYLDKPLTAFSYRAAVQTKKDEWIEVRLPLDEFVATSFGRLVKDTGPVDPKEITALGFMLGDKKAGPFKMEVESVMAARAVKKPAPNDSTRRRSVSKALLVIDLQNDYFPGGKFPLWNTDSVLRNVERAVEKANVRGIPAIHVQHVANGKMGIAPFFTEGTAGADIHPRILAAAPTAPVVVKEFADGFEKTTLEETLAKLGVTDLLVCGMMTQNCVTHTAISKAAEKYGVTILPDCCTTVSEILHLIALHAVSTRVKLVPSSEVL